MPESSVDFVALAVLDWAVALETGLLPLLVFVFLVVLAALLLDAGFAEAFVEPFVAAAFVEEDRAVDLSLAADLVLSDVFAAAAFAAEDFAAEDFAAEDFAADRGFSVALAGSAADLLSALVVAVFAAVFVVMAAVDLGAGAVAGRDFALAGPDMVKTAVATVTTRATESRRARFMGVFFLEQADTTGRLFRYPLNAV